MGDVELVRCRPNGANVPRPADRRPPMLSSVREKKKLELSTQTQTQTPHETALPLYLDRRPPYTHNSSKRSADGQRGQAWNEPRADGCDSMHLMYTLDAEGKRIYTLKKVVDGRITSSAHPARFSPDDTYSRWVSSAAEAGRSGAEMTSQRRGMDIDSEQASRHDQEEARPAAISAECK